MKVQGTELFAITELNEYNDKFTVREQAIRQKVTEYEAQILKAQNDYETALEVDILEDTSASHTRLANIDSKLKNLCELRNSEIAKLDKLQDLKVSGIHKLIPEAKQKLNDDLQTYYNEVEYELLRELAQLREQTENALLLLQKARSVVSNELFEFDQIAESAGHEKLKFNMSNASFHQATNIPYRPHPELGMPMLNLQNLSAVESQLSRNRAETNAKCNEEQRKDLKPAKTVASVDLDAWLDKLGRKKK